MKKYFLSIFCLMLGGMLYAHQQGNIVEYFGKERVDRVDEGAVLHWFKNGYSLPLTARSGYLFNNVDGLGWEIATDKFSAPKKGNVEAANYGLTDNIIMWRPIEVDSAGKFTGREMRRSYLYTEYNAAKEQVALLEASGNTRTFINGMPHEGDHYDFAYTLIPIRLKKGINEFLFTPGRFGRVEVKLIIPNKPVMFTKRDMTLPDIINSEANEKWAGIRVVNVQDRQLSGLSIKCTLESGETSTFKTDDIMPMTVRKLKFTVPASKSVKTATVKATVMLLSNGKELDRTEITLQQRDASGIHERTFISNVDGSVQYYSITPSTNNAEGQALFLSLHGASVEARNQARAYKQKDWGHIIAPTNRRPFGFNWEEWGRIDALEVLADARKIFKTAPEKTYLTGHSMGGHGTWVVGVNYPDKFAAIAPCAGYADISRYSRQNADRMHESKKHYTSFESAANAGRTLEMKNNFIQQGVYIFHGGDDRVVPTAQARAMREVFGTFHPDFCYYEYPGGSHWFSNESVDWNPIFEFFKRHKLYRNDEVKSIEFTTASPAISAKDYWLTVLQQDTCYSFSTVKFNIIGDTIKGTTKNTAALSLDLPLMKFSGIRVNINIDGQIITANADKALTLKKNDNNWQSVESIAATEKNPARYGGFKQVFDNNVVFVYATAGTRTENEWYMNKARFDAETFLYRGNGSIDVIADKDFKAEAYADRNVVLYGNATNNKAWTMLLSNAPVQVRQGEVKVGNKVFKGNNYGAYFIYPRPDSKTASVGVVAGTGMEGMKATFANDYISGFTGYPDLSVFTVDILRDGIDAVKASGFFGNDWSVDKGNILFD